MKEYNPMQAACHKGHLQIVQWFHTHGAFSKHCNAALIASQKQHFSLLQWLVRTNIPSPSNPELWLKHVSEKQLRILFQQCIENPDNDIAEYENYLTLKEFSTRVNLNFIATRRIGDFLCGCERKRELSFEIIAYVCIGDNSCKKSPLFVATKEQIACAKHFKRAQEQHVHMKTGVYNNKK